MSPDPRLSELLEQWRRKHVYFRALAREANYQGRIEADAYRSGKEIVYQECADELAAVLLGGTPQLEKQIPMREVADVSRLDVAIADVVACFMKWDTTPDLALDKNTIEALHDLVAEWKRHRKAAVCGGAASSPTPEHHCEACPMEVRNLYAVAFNLLNLMDDPDRWVRKIGERLGELKRAVALIQPLIDRHFDGLGRQPAAPVRPVQEKPEV